MMCNKRLQNTRRAARSITADYGGNTLEPSRSHEKDLKNLVVHHRSSHHGADPLWVFRGRRGGRGVSPAGGAGGGGGGPRGGRGPGLGGNPPPTPPPQGAGGRCRHCER